MEAATLRLQMTDDGNIAPAGNLRRSRKLLQRYHPDCALLDLNLNGTLAFA